MSKLHVSPAVALVLSAFAVLFSGLAMLFAVGALDAEKPAPQDFEAQVHAYLIENPEVIIESFRRLEERQQAAQLNELESIIAGRRDEIFNDPAAPVGGNPDGDVTLVEFFDYNCPYCRKAAPILTEAKEADSGLRLVYKEFPVLGPGSEFAARATLASRAQGEYEAFHERLMGHSGPLNESSTLEVAAEVGLDIEQLKQDMEDPAISAAIERNRELAGALRITGTPSFVVGDEIVRGLVDLAELQRAIADARKEPEG